MCPQGYSSSITDLLIRKTKNVINPKTFFLSETLLHMLCVHCKPLVEFWDESDLAIVHCYGFKLIKSYRWRYWRLGWVVF